MRADIIICLFHYRNIDVLCNKVEQCALILVLASAIKHNELENLSISGVQYRASLLLLASSTSKSYSTGCLSHLSYTMQLYCVLALAVIKAPGQHGLSKRHLCSHR